MLTALAIMSGMVFALALVGIVALPFIAPHLANDPKRPERYYIFTKVEPNQFKFVMVGGKIKKGLMNFPGHKIVDEGDGLDAYEIVPSAEIPDQTEEMNFLEGVVYHYSGYRYVGIVFGNLYTYPFSRVEEFLRQDGNLEIEGKTSISDHFVLSEQTYPFEIPNVETGGEENVLITIRGKFTIQIINPRKAAFVSRGQFLQQILAALRVRGKNYARGRGTFDQLLGTTKEIVEAETKQKILESVGSDLVLVNDTIETGPGSANLWGVRLLRVLVEDIQMTDPEAEKSRTKRYIATRDAEVKTIGADADAAAYKKIKAGQATGDAGYLETVTEAIHKNGSVAVMLTQQQTQIATAKEAENLILNIGAGDSVNPIDAAILQELKTMNSSKQTTTPPEKPEGQKEGGKKQ